MNEQTKAVETGWRGSLEGWLDAAYESLTECGVDTVRVMPLAKKLGLSRTSFYWFFKDREELLAALIERWRVKNTGNLIAQTECYAESIAEAMLNVFDCWLNPELFDSQFEFAMRSWALQSAEVAEHIREADIARREALIRMFVRFDYAFDAADVRARTIYLTQIGYISTNTREDVGERMRRIPEYVKIFTGQEPLERELKRFYSRHGYVMDEVSPLTPD